MSYMQDYQKQKVRELLSKDEDFINLIKFLRQSYYIKHYVLADCVYMNSLLISDSPQHTITYLLDFLGSKGYSNSLIWGVFPDSDAWANHAVKVINQLLFNIAVAASLWDKIKSGLVYKGQELAFNAGEPTKGQFVNQCIIIGTDNSTEDLALDLYVKDLTLNNSIDIKFIINRDTVENGYLKDLKLRVTNETKQYVVARSISAANLNSDYIIKCIDDVI